MIKYFGMKACHSFAFPWIYDELSSDEPTSVYENEKDGLANLEKVLAFVKNDEYYPDFADKCSYILCGIAGSQYFHNGNKRLGVTMLLMFLQKNDAYILDSHQDLKTLVKKRFPKHAWEENKNLSEDAHELFLYNVAIIIGDRHRWNTNDFNEMRKNVTNIFESTYLFFNNEIPGKEED